jgi:hypothetical protein
VTGNASESSLGYTRRMKPSYGSALGLGAVVGLVLSMAAMLFVGATGGVPKLDVVGTGSRVDPSFAVPASALWIVAILAAAGCGIVLAIGTRGIARIIDPDSRGVPVAVNAAVGAVVAGILTFAIFPLGVSLLGSLQDGVATVSVVEMALMTATLGVVGGAIIVWLSYLMSRPPQPTEDPELLLD